jgi:chromate transporter
LSETFGLVQIVPGINLVALALITGLRLAGWAGAVSSVAGLIAPSFLVTVAMTAIYTRIVDIHVVQTGVRGMVTAAGAMSIVAGWRLFYPAFRASSSESPLTAAATVVITLSAGALVLLAAVAVFALVLVAGALMAAVLWVKRGSVRPKPS